MIFSLIKIILNIVPGVVVVVMLVVVVVLVVVGVLVVVRVVALPASILHVMHTDWHRQHRAAQHGPQPRTQHVLWPGWPHRGAAPPPTSANTR